MPLRRFDQAEIILSHRRRLEMPLLATVWLGVAAFSIAEGSFFYVLAATLAVGVNVLAVRRHQEVYVRRTYVNIGVLAATAVLLVEIAGSGTPPILALGHYLILIQLCKLFEQKRDRDYVQLLAMSILLIVAGSVTCTRLWFALALLVYIALVCHTAMVFTLKRGLDAAASARLAVEPDPLHPRLVAWGVIRDWPRRALGTRLVVVLAAVLVTGLMMFLLAPRQAWSGGLTGEGVSGSALSGFKNYVRLGETNRIYLSDEEVMSVRVRSAGEGPGGQMRPLYLRGMTFDTYSNSTWANSRRTAAPRSPGADWGETIIQEISCDASLLPTMFGVWPVARCQSPDGAVRFDNELNLTLSYHSLRGRTATYTVWSYAQPLTDRQRGEVLDCIDPPEGDPARGAEATPPVRKLAEEWCADLLAQRRGLPPGPRRDGIDLGIAERLSERLRRDYPYTLDLADSNPDRDGVEDFLLHMKKGHCEYFASALTVLCRSAGVHARLATGFRCDSPALPGGAILVRASDAHAWTEVYTPSTLWVPFDATAAGQFQSSRAWWGWFKRLWQTVRFSWNEKVVGYNEIARQRLGHWLVETYRAVTGAIARALRTLRDSVVNLLVHGYIDAALGYISLVVSLVGMGLLGLLIARTARREMRYRQLLREGKTVPWPQVGFFRRLLAALQRGGFEASPGRTARENVLAAADQFNLPRPALEELVDLYYSLRWGRIEAAPHRIRSAEQQVAEIARMLKR